MLASNVQNNMQQKLTLYSFRCTAFRPFLKGAIHKPHCQYTHSCLKTVNAALQLKYFPIYVTQKWLGAMFSCNLLLLLNSPNTIIHLTLFAFSLGYRSKESYTSLVGNCAYSHQL